MMYTEEEARGMNIIQRRRMIRIRYVLEDWLPRIAALLLGALIAVMVLG